MTLRPYPEYRESRIAWLGSIPAGWEVGKFRYVFSESSEVNGSKPVGEMLSVSGYRGVELKVYDDENRKRTDADLETYRVVRPGQLAVNTMWLNYAGLGVSDLTGYVSPAYRSYNISPGVDGRFIHHLMRCGIYVNAYTGELTGIRPNSLQMNRGTLMEWPVLLPPSAEQRQIAEYLDVHTAKIDALVGKQERLIETLAERRQAVISHAVTKGLDPNAPMKDSGLDWMGTVPQSWTVEKLSRHFAARKGADAALLTHEYCASVPGDYPVYSGQTESGGVMARINTFEFDSGVDGVLFSTTVGARAMTVQQITGQFSLSQNCMIIQRRGHLSVRYYYYLFQTLFEAQRRELSAHMQPSFRMADLYGYRILIPTSQEQREIANFLDDETARVDALSAKAREMIVVLKERRQALINAAVTGKIDVRGLS